MSPLYATGRVVIVDLVVDAMTRYYQYNRSFKKFVSRSSTYGPPGSDDFLLPDNVGTRFGPNGYRTIMSEIHSQQPQSTTARRVA